MRRILLAVALAATCAVPTLAAGTGGVSGFVTDLATGKPVPSVAVAIYKLPVTPNAPAIESAISDRKGFFVNLHLDPGRYLVTANLQGHTSSCIVDDVFEGQVARMKIEIGGDGQRCIGPRVHSAILNPNDTSDIYRI